MGRVGGRLKRQGTYIYLQLINVVVQQKLIQHCKAIMCSVAQSWTIACQAPQSVEFSRQEYWSGVPLPSPIYTLLCIKQIARGKLLYSTGSSAQCSVMAQRDGMGSEGRRYKREGISVYIWLIHLFVQHKPAQHCKAIILQFSKSTLLATQRASK